MLQRRRMGHGGRGHRVGYGKIRWGAGAMGLSGWGLGAGSWEIDYHMCLQTSQSTSNLLKTVSCYSFRQFFRRSVTSVGPHFVLTFKLFELGFLSSNKEGNWRRGLRVCENLRLALILGESGEEIIGLALDYKARKCEDCGAWRIWRLLTHIESSSYIDKDADEVVTVKFFHGNKLVKNRNDSEWSYLGGEVSLFDYCEIDYMSMLKLFGMAKDLGYDDGTVPKSNNMVIVLYLKVVSLNSSQVGNDSSDQEYSCFEDNDSSDLDFEDKENDESENGEKSPTLTCPNSSSSEDDAVGELRRKKNRTPKGEDFRPEIDMENPGFKIGLKFATAELFRKAVRIYSINCGRELIFMNNDRNKIRVVCEEGCLFVIHASSVSGSIYLQLRLNPNWTASSFAEQVHQDYGYRPSKATGYRAKAMAIDIVEGSYSDRSRFQRIYICLAACKKGFLDGCKHVVCLDGCHVKWPHPGQVLSAMGVDANNGMFPLAYAYVEIESDSTWLWFLELLSGDLNITNSHGYVFMTDKQKGLIHVVDALFPHAKHRHCLKHLYGNFYLEHIGLALKHQMKAIARATTMPWFHVEMRKMLKLSKPAHDWLAEKDPRHWSRAYFKSDSKCDMLMNNLCEAFNRSIMDARYKPVLTMLERIRLYIMLLMAGRRIFCEKWHGQVGPRIRKILEKNKGKAQWCIPKATGQNKFEVMHHSGRNFAVDLNAHSCSCHAWDLNGIPCLHACTAISWFHGNPEDFCDAVYKKEAYLRAYEPMIMPMTSQDHGEGHNRISCKEPRNPNIKPTRKRKIANEKLAVRRRYGGDQSSGQQSMQLRQRKQASSSQGPSQSQASQVVDASQSQPSQAVDASESQPS
ncbi:unnamed protein product [Prunus armeniaca]